MNQIVARYQDGRLVKGVTSDFLPTKDRFHVVPAGGATGTRPLEVAVGDLKALFFVKDYQGNPSYAEMAAFDAAKPASGRRIRVIFKDGETLLGTTQGYQPGRPGFFLFPADSRSNNQRCYVVMAATKEVSFV